MTIIKSNMMGFLQKMSSAFLIPVAFLSFGGLLMGITSIFRMDYVVSYLPIVSNPVFNYINGALFLIAGFVFDNLPILFAVTVTISIAKDEKAIAGFVALIGYFVFNIGMGYLLQYEVIRSMFPANAIGNILGYETLKTGVLGGIIVGIVTALIHNKIYEVKLPMIFGFFSGIRFVAIGVSFFMLIFSQIFVFIWIPISEGINALAHIVGQAGVFGPFFYGFVERLLIPTGLHHVWNAVIRNTEISGVAIIAGQEVAGVLNIYNKYLQTGIIPDMPLYEVTRFLRGGQIPTALFVLPAIALAIYKNAFLQNKPLIKSLLISGVFTSVMAGVTEPLEFAFLFASPVLYIIYAIICGISFTTTYVLHTAVGGTEPNVFGLLIFGILRPESKWYLNLLVGVILAPITYILFNWYIIRFQIKTPGREDEQENNNVLHEIDSHIPEDIKNNPLKRKAYIIIQGLGGVNNIIGVENCISRLRVKLKDGTQFKEHIINTTGCSGIIKIDETHFQIIYGTSVNMIKEAVNKQIKE